jgi:hypothetical protein
MVDIYPMEMEGIIPVVKTGRRNTLSPGLDKIGAEIAVLAAQRESGIHFALLGHTISPGPERRRSLRKFRIRSGRRRRTGK